MTGQTAIAALSTTVTIAVANVKIMRSCNLRSSEATAGSTFSSW